MHSAGRLTGRTAAVLGFLWNVTLLNSSRGVASVREVNCLQTVIPWSVSRELVAKADDETDPRYGFKPEERPMPLRIKYGIMNIDKPAGPSSHEVVAWIKRMMKLSHAGHGGTLET